MKTAYCWDHDQEIVVEVQVPQAPVSVKNEAQYRFLVDTNVHPDNPDHRYGMWIIDGNGDLDWVCIPKECLPKKFLAALLILGVR